MLTEESMFWCFLTDSLLFRKRNRSRKKKIDDILKITLCDYHDRFTSQCSDSSSEENSSDDDDDDLEEEMDVEEEVSGHYQW